MDILESHHRKIIIILVIVILVGGGFWILKHFHPALFLGEPDLVVEAEAAPPLPPPSSSPPTSSAPSVSPQPSEGLSTPSDGARININTATSQELQTLPGIGPAIAQRIIEYRQTSGGFSTVDDLTNVKGIGEKRLEKIRHLVAIYW